MGTIWNRSNMSVRQFRKFAYGHFCFFSSEIHLNKIGSQFACISFEQINSKFCSEQYGPHFFLPTKKQTTNQRFSKCVIVFLMFFCCRKEEMGIILLGKNMKFMCPAEIHAHCESFFPPWRKNRKIDKQKKTNISVRKNSFGRTFPWRNVRTGKNCSQLFHK